MQNTKTTRQLSYTSCSVVYKNHSAAWCTEVEGNKNTKVKYKYTKLVLKCSTSLWAQTLNNSWKLSAKRWISSSVAVDTIKFRSVTVSGFIHYRSTLLDSLCAGWTLIYQGDSERSSVGHLAGFQPLSIEMMWRTWRSLFCSQSLPDRSVSLGFNQYFTYWYSLPAF